MAILTWQVGIFLGILAAGVLLGRGGVILAAIVATVWTVAMVYTNPLMILQFFVVLISSLAAWALSTNLPVRLFAGALAVFGLYMANGKDLFSPNNQYAISDIQRDPTGRIQRSSSARTEFIRKSPCPATGLSSGSCPGYIVDHIVPLKRGGPDTPNNMQWQTEAAAKAKDRWE